MKTKFMNWWKKHNYLYGACLVVASLCLIAFGFATMGEGSTEASEPVADIALNSMEENAEFITE